MTMARGFCNDCGHYSTDISYTAGFRCLECRERIEREREDERRRRDLAFQRGLRSVREFFEHDRVFYAAIRRTDWDDPISVQHLYGFALQRGRPDYAERLREVARESGFDTTGWERMIPERLNPERLRNEVLRWRLLSIEPSWVEGKKLAAIFHDEVNDHPKTVHFGAVGYEDYTTHKDPKRKERYLERHGRGREDWDDPTTPGALSRWILWNKPTLKASIDDFKRRFRL